MREIYVWMSHNLNEQTGSPVDFCRDVVSSATLRLMPSLPSIAQAMRRAIPQRAAPWTRPRCSSSGSNAAVLCGLGENDVDAAARRFSLCCRQSVRSSSSAARRQSFGGDAGRRLFGARHRWLAGDAEIASRGSVTPSRRCGSTSWMRHEAYDGVWASACLLHVSSATRLARASCAAAFIARSGRQACSTPVQDGRESRRDSLGSVLQLRVARWLESTYAERGGVASTVVRDPRDPEFDRRRPTC